jgi:hypothetical protein
MLVFSAQLYKLHVAPQTFSLVQLPPPPFPVSKYSMYIVQTVCCWEGVRDVEFLLETIF